MATRGLLLSAPSPGLPSPAEFHHGQGCAYPLCRLSRFRKEVFAGSLELALLLFVRKDGTTESLSVSGCVLSDEQGARDII